MTDRACASEWKYLKVYVGDLGDRLDELITETVPVVLTCVELESWFFLRYVDDGGIHLRLRFRASAIGEAEAADHVVSICAQGLSALASSVPRPYRPMVASDLGRPRLTASKQARVVRDTYEPEVVAFGGREGLDVAEEAFRASSEVALEILLDEREGRYSRKTVAPLLMDAAVSAFALEAATADSFWQKYALFWLGGAGDFANRWLDQFLERGRELRAEDVQILALPEDRPATSIAHLERWQRAMQRCASDYRKLARSDVTPSLLCGQFVHLMNNRLGLNVVEEAYLATLLGQRAGT
jgi:thiopeptide-type bacteriocin biosynthesis protein